MFGFTLSDKFLSKDEQKVFEEHIKLINLDKGVWEVFACLFRSKVKNARPLLLRIFKRDELAGAIIITKCTGYGNALFSNKILSGFINLLKIPYYQWIKFGCCMDMMSNPGFVKNPEESNEILRAAIQFLRKKSLLLIVTDYTTNSGLYENASVLPALPHALIDCSKMVSIQDYLKDYKNLKRKMNVFKIKGGEYISVERQLNEEQLIYLKKCFLSTSQKSVFYLPYQDLYLSSAITTSKTNIENVHYFIALMDGQFIGYQAALKAGSHLNALHGAFDRDRKTTYHAYDILFVKMTEFAIENGLKTIDFGAVLNFTKQKMVNMKIEMSYFLLSRYKSFQLFFNMLLKITKVQSKHQLRFRDDDTIIYR
ncbi:MAG: GNAT family N-acetyltransferase [Bacteroidales bacterium]|nr:GNAT family N-acetyltransferase [Bacteroidales bacterium]